MKKILGITAEYDPFHSGHAYQLEEARKAAEPDAVVCVMSGDFTQRGEPAVLDKWIRARIAAQQGVDLVLELPFMYACSRAERFAAGAVDMLVSAGATHISFGCEAEQPEDLQILADGQLGQAQMAEDMIRDFMKAGYSRAKASELVSRKLFGDELTELMLAPNNILALEYLKRIRWWEESGGISIRSVPVRRLGSGYHTANAAAGFAGASAIRQMLAAGEDVASYLSYDREGLVWEDLTAARGRLYDLVRGIVLRSTPAQLARIYCVGEGMENRLLREVRSRENYEDFLSSMISKRYTAAAIRRIMLYILLNIDEMPDCAPYGRVLAATKTGRKLLRQLGDGEVPGIGSDREHVKPDPEHAGADREHAGSRMAIPGSTVILPLTVIANGNRLEGVTEPVRRALALDERAADMYHLICGRSVEEKGDARRHPFMAEA